MKNGILENMGMNNDRKDMSLTGLVLWAPRFLVPMLALFFLPFALLYATSAIIEFIKPVLSDGDLAGGLVKGLHMGVVALTIYEMAQVVHQNTTKAAKRRMRSNASAAASRVSAASYTSHWYSNR